MSTGEKRPYDEMIVIARAFEEEIAFGCHRTLIAGSLRRRKPMIGDIELVVQPRLVQDVDPMFREPVGPPRSLLDTCLDALPGVEWKIDGQVARGKKYQKLLWNGAKIDLFIQPDPATWGFNSLLRTGSAEFSHWCMIVLGRKGYTMKEARIWQDDVALNTPDEESIFALMGMDVVPPEQRTAEFVDAKRKARA